MTTTIPRNNHPPAPTPERKRILIVDDHPLMRSGLLHLINKQPGLEVCGEAGSPAEAMVLLVEHRPDLIVVDITMKGASGLEFIKNVCALHGHIPMLVLSMHDEKVYAERALRAGACGYIMKEESGEYLIAAMQRVLEGGIYLSKAMSAQLLRSITNPQSRNADSPLQQLTDREFEVFRLIGQGRTSQEIAEHLHISPKTVDVHRFQIKEKLQLKSGPALVHYAVQWVGTEGAGAK
jgi:DNA-binding NarL/FixJ family response regulator